MFFLFPGCVLGFVLFFSGSDVCFVFFVFPRLKFS